MFLSLWVGTNSKRGAYMKQGANSTICGIYVLVPFGIELRYMYRRTKIHTTQKHKT